MIPKSKKNLHECEYHLNLMLKCQNIEELEINFSAFVNSARNVTFVLQKEFKNAEGFLDWYGNPDNLEESREGTKIYEMRYDELCVFFKELRNKILKEGINQIECNTKVIKFNSLTDVIDRPNGSKLIFKGKGIYYLINEGTKQEDLIPAKTKARMITTVFIKDAPKRHLGKTILNNDIIGISEIYYLYLKNLVEEWVNCSP